MKLLFGWFVIGFVMKFIAGNELFHVFEKKEPVVNGIASNNNNEFQNLIQNGNKVNDNQVIPEVRDPNHLEVQSDHPPTHKLLNSPVEALNAAPTAEDAKGEGSDSSNIFQKLFTGPSKEEGGEQLPFDTLNELALPLPNKLLVRRRVGGGVRGSKLMDRSRRHLRGSTD